MSYLPRVTKVRKIDGYRVSCMLAFPPCEQNEVYITSTALFFLQYNTFSKISIFGID